MHASGTGKAILSSLPEEHVRKLLIASGLTPFTDRTLTNPGDLFADLKTTRERGYSFDQEERYSGMSCIGSVIYDEHNEACGGVSISGPSTRFDPLRVPELGATVAEAAAEITENIGGQIPNLSSRSAVATGR